MNPGAFVFKFLLKVLFIEAMALIMDLFRGLVHFGRIFDAVFIGIVQTILGLVVLLYRSVMFTWPS